MSSGDPETFLKPEDWPPKDKKWLKNMLLSQLETIRASSIRIKDRNEKLLELQKENEDLLRHRLVSMKKRRASKETCLSSFLDLGQSTPLKTSSPESKGNSPTPYLRTKEPYYTSRGEEFVRKDRIELQKITENCQVPDWRVVQEVVPKGSAASKDGKMENLEDDVILKRHYKFELDEIKRKRWDLQRLRALRQTEKLKGRNAAIVAKEEVIHSVEPNVDSLTHICVADYLPISAFGAPLPLLPKMPFSLEWT